MKKSYIPFLSKYSLLLLCSLLYASTNQLAAQCCSNGVNLLATYNPDFSAPIVTTPPGFVTDNTFSTTPGAGTYVIIRSRNYGACGATPQFDHTVGDTSGRYLWFDTRGTATIANPATAWLPFDPSRPPGTQNLITVTPNTLYVFSVWIRDLARNTNCISGGAPLMGLRINGVDMAQIDLGLVTNPCCPQWTYLCSEWNSGADTTALIRIESRRGAGFTDLGIDDVYFGSTNTVNFNLGNDTSICQGQTLQIGTSLLGATYLWNDGSTGSSLTVASPGFYWLKATQNSCSGSDSIDITQQLFPIVNAGSDTLVCNQSSFLISPVFTGGTVTNYLWQDNSTSANYTANTNGLYWIEASNACGSNRDSVNISFLLNPSVFSLGSDTTICSGNSIVLSPSPFSAGNFLWQDNSIGSTVSATNGLYWLDISNQCGRYRDSINVSLLSPPASFSLGSDTLICNGSSISLLPSSATTGNYIWQDGSTGNSFSANSAGSYSLRVSNNCGTVSDTITVSLNFAPTVLLSNDTVLCGIDSILIAAQITEQGNLLWSNGSNSFSIYVSTSGIYSVSISNGCGVSQDEMEVTFLALPEKPFNNSVIDSCENALIVLDAKNQGMSYLWSNEQIAQSISPSAEGIFSVTITNSSVCSITDSVMVQYHSCSSCQAVVPTAFSPNGDGANDIFKTLFSCGVQSFTLSIYNRWGEKVFETNDPQDGWNGIFKSREQPVSTYVFYTEFRFRYSQKTERITGNVTLLR